MRWIAGQSFRSDSTLHNSSRSRLPPEIAATLRRLSDRLSPQAQRCSRPCDFSTETRKEWCLQGLLRDKRPDPNLRHKFEAPVSRAGENVLRTPGKTGFL